VILAAAASGAISARVFAPDDDGAARTATPVRTSTPSTGGEPALEDAVRQTAPSVVTVRTSFGQGSGVVLQPSGLIVTNEHVVQGSSRVEVISATGVSMSADVLKADDFQDLAILRPAGEPGPGVRIVEDTVGPPSIGSTVFAIGSPFGFENTVTAGVVSAFREQGGRPLIQFDAPINPGNSGGGLFDVNGELIGIPTLIQSPIPGNVGLGFAVPASRVRAMLAQVS
jgi:S1-C subfamily serine protease